MKVVIVSPPKSGANRLRCLLAAAYGFRVLDARDAPVSAEPPELAHWLTSLPDHSVTHTSLPFDEALPARAAELSVPLIAIIRHPFDLFVSNQAVRSNRKQRKSLRARNRDSSLQEPDFNREDEPRDPVVELAGDVQALLDWSDSAMVTLRYEDILERPDAVLSKVSKVIGELNDIQIAHAVKLCPAEQRIVSSSNRGARMAEIAPGTWRDAIDPSTLTQLQSSFELSVVSLGYESTLANTPRKS